MNCNYSSLRLNHKKNIFWYFSLEFENRPPKKHRPSLNIYSGVLPNHPSKMLSSKIKKTSSSIQPTFLLYSMFQLAPKLNNPQLLKSQGFLAGDWVGESANGKKFVVYNPVNQEAIAELPDMGVEETKKAIQAAYAAQNSWAGLIGKERAKILHQLHKLILENHKDLATLICAEMGKPLAESKSEILNTASYVEWFAEEAKRLYGDTIPADQPNKRYLVIKQPIGVVAAITPWNFPSAMLSRKLSPALACGCAFIAKPSELTPLSALALAYLAEQAGVPKGLLSVITSTDAGGVGHEICTNPEVRKITFTGSTEVGRILLKQSADQVKKLSLELGGNAPFIVCDDADLDAAIEGLMVAKYRNNGQTCVCANRIFVQSRVYEEFCQKLVAATEKLQVGDGFDDGVQLGPLINQEALDKVESYIANARAKGAEVLTGGKRHERGGTFFEPTVVSGVSGDMLVARNEIFGPVAAVLQFDTLDEVIARANDTIYGLASYFYTRDIGRIWKLSEGLEYGVVGANTGITSSPVAPFGGFKQSGLGREGSKYGCDDYVETKYICHGGLGD